MKISEIILDKLSETKLYEMVRERQRAFDNIRNLSDTMIEHIIKILMYGKTYEYDGWISELTAYSNQIIDSSNRYYRKTKKLINSDTYYDLLFTDNVENVSGLEMIVNDINKKVNRTAVKRNLPPMKVISDHRIIHKNLSHIVNEISDKLETNEIPDFETILEQFV